MADSTTKRQLPATELVATLDIALGAAVRSWNARTVMAAVDLGMFDVLADRCLTRSELSAVLTLPERSVGVLLEACHSTGLLNVSARTGVVELTEPARRHLTTTSAYSIRNYVLDERWCWPAWADLESHLRDGSQGIPADGQGYHEFPEDFLLDFNHGIAYTIALRTAELVDLSGARRLLDVGGGSGGTSIGLCEQFESLRATVVDQPMVLTRARDHIDASPSAARINTAARDVFNDVLPFGHDVAVLANLLHDFSEDRSKALLARTAEVLDADARVLIIDICPDRSPDSLLAGAFSAVMAVNTEGGYAYGSDVYEKWLRQLGFSVAIHDTGSTFVNTVVEGRRTSGSG